jgi:hypothetical protein
VLVEVPVRHAMERVREYISCRVDSRWLRRARLVEVPASPFREVESVEHAKAMVQSENGGWSQSTFLEV